MISPGTTTFLFTDIESSTAEWERSSDMSGRLHRHLTILQETVAMFGGVVFASMGDGIAAAFSSADAAVHAAISAQGELPTSGLRARMGLHTGEAEQVGHDHRGRPVNRAACIMSVGHGGQILLSDLCASLVRSGPDPVELADLGTHRLRGLRDPERLWQVLDPALEERFAPVHGVGTMAPDLPRSCTPLIGRDREVARLTDLVRRVRIITLSGPGGVGKTRLALQAAQELSSFADARLVELANVSVGAPWAEVGCAIVAAVGIGSTSDPIDTTVAMLEGHDVLLVIDNCEHVIDGAAEVISELTDRCPRLRVVVTSREPLGIDGEHVVRVAPLPATTACSLFRSRAEAAGMEPDAIDDDLAFEIVRRLDGLPLAIELTVARAVTLGLPAIVDGLAHRSPSSARRRRGKVDRHATMAATMAWSYDLLGREEQALLGHLAVFPNGAELDAVIDVAERLGIGAADATEHLASLVDKSMLVAEPDQKGVRYRMLETIRGFVLDRLDVAGERTVAQLALAEWMASITDVPFAAAGTLVTEQAAIRLEREADNWRDALRAAIRAGRGDLAARLCGPATVFFLLGRHDLAPCVRLAVDLCRTDRDQRRATLCALMVSAAGTSSPAQLQEWADEMAEIEERSPTGLGCLMQWLARIWNGDFDGAVAACLAGADDPRLEPTMRDLLLWIAVLDHFSLTGATTDPHGLIDGGWRAPSAPTWRCPCLRSPGRRLGPGRVGTRSVHRAGAPRHGRPRRGAGSDPADPAGQRLPAARRAGSEHRGQGPARTARRLQVPPVVRRPDPARLRRGAARPGRPPRGAAGARGGVGRARRAAPVDDGLRRARPADGGGQQPRGARGGGGLHPRGPGGGRLRDERSRARRCARRPPVARAARSWSGTDRA
ncbi:NB-ARC domain-containing protein [Aquihabitans sp. McL0605]|uniref:NB-ARC domain-containing protein n=1 Tax=Aquihabitans sp. McL0605 TaxID=3415671 RepID=UPI003CEC1677